MKTGKSLVELAKQLQDIKDNSRDFIVPTEKMKVSLEEIADETERRKAEAENAEPPAPKVRPVVEFENGDRERFQLNGWSDRQMSTYSEIPHAYYQRIKSEDPALFARNVNHGLQRKVAESGSGETRMLRTYRNGIRAFVSARYRRLDCYDLLNTVFPIMADNNFDLKSSEITDTRMYIQAVTPKVKAEIKVGDTVQFGLVISSSDVGAGSLRVEPLIYRWACLNGMITSAAIRKFHIGRNQAENDVYELLTDDTKELTDAAFWSQVKDVVLGSMKPDVFDKEVDKLRIAANEPIQNFDLPRVVELTAKAIGISGEATKQSMVEYLASGADGAGLTKWGLANAVTAAAKSDDVGYDDAVDLERAGAKVIDLTPKQWSVIAAKPAS